MIATFLAFLSRAWAWFIGTRVGRITLAVGAALLAVFLIDRRGYRRGSEETEERIDEASDRAADEREQFREDIDRATDKPGAADRLRDRWSRD